MFKTFALAAAFALAMIAAPAQASDQSELLDHANRTVDHLKSDPAFSVARDMMHRAKAVLMEFVQQPWKGNALHLLLVERLNRSEPGGGARK